MTLRYWLLMSAVGTAGLSTACSSEPHSCYTTRTCAEVGGSGGGEHVGGNAGAAEAPGESGGRSVGDSGEAGRMDNSEGEAGSGGESGESDDVPVLFGACNDKGAFVCVEHASAQRLACDGERWQAGTTCAAGQFCDSSNGKCAPIISECSSAKPGAAVCRGDSLITCGADLVTASAPQTCGGRCKLGVCQLPTCGDGKVESGEDCDDAAAAASGACVKCKTASCGDGVVYAGHEPCDDGNLVSGDGCSATCKAEPVELALGDDFTCARSSTGLVKCWGLNDAGQLGLGKSIESLGGTPDTVPSLLAVIDLGSGLKARSITAHGGSACAQLDNGQVKCWGNNSFGQLGTGDRDHRGDNPGEMGDVLKPIPLGLEAKAVSAGGDHSCVLLTGGTVKCWGRNAYGQLGQGNTADVLSPTDIAAIKLKLPATAISAASFAGSGRGGNMGGATCALLSNDTVQCWGYADVVPSTSASDIDGSSGIGDYAGEMELLPVLSFEGGRTAQSIAAGNASAAILNDGSLRLWGWGRQLDSLPYDMSPTELASEPAVLMGKKVISITTNIWHACAILEDGALKCWGSVDSGALGLGSTLATQGPPKDLASVDLGGHAATRVAAGPRHTCAILDDGTIRCWGANSYGQLGLGDTNNRGATGTKLSADTSVSLSF